MAVALVQEISAYSGSATTTSHILNGVTAGNALVMGIHIRTDDPAQTPDTTDDNGNTWAAFTGAENGGCRVYVDYALNVASGNTTATFDQDTNTYADNSSFMELSGVATSSAADINKSATGSSTTPATGTSATTAQADEIAIAVLGHDGFANPLGIDLPSGYTNVHLEDNGAASWCGSIDYKILSGTGTENVSWGTVAASDAWAAMVVTLKAAASGATTIPHLKLPMLGVG